MAFSGEGELAPVWEDAEVSQETILAMQQLTRAALATLESPLMWMLKIMSVEGPISFPNAELGALLVTVCLASRPVRGHAWLYLDHALSVCLICPMHTLAILTARVIPIRHQHVEVYQIYLEFVDRLAWNISTSKPPQFRARCVKLVDEVLQFSQMGVTSVTDFGTCMLCFSFCLVKRLTDATAEDWSSPPAAWNDEQNMYAMRGHDVINLDDDPEENQLDKREQMKNANSLQALELVAKIFHNNRTATLLRLARRKLPDQWKIFVRDLSSLDVIGRSGRPSIPKEAPETLRNLAAAIEQCVIHGAWRTSHLPVIQALVDGGSRSVPFGNNLGVECSNPWLPLDIFMESAMERGKLHVRPPSINLADMMKTLQAVQGAAWHEVFLGTWIAALRLIQRDREWIEGPSKRISTRMCMLLSHVPLACLALVKEEEKCMSDNCDVEGDGLLSSREDGDGKQKPDSCSRRNAVVLSLQLLGQFEALLTPPNIAISAANRAAASVATKLRANGIAIDPRGMATPVGNLRHLMVEACISRRLLDTSAYFWLSESGGSFSAPSPVLSSPWSAFMEGAPLTTSLQSALKSSPAGSLAELEEMYQIAMSGPVEGRAAAASILCGASLTQSWNVQEHVFQLVIRLLSPPSDPDHRSPESHLIPHGPVLYVALDAMTSEDILHMLGLNGMYPELATSLLPICEVFGSLPPALPRNPRSGTDVYTIFSLAFLLLTRLWQFQRVPLEHCVAAGSGIAPVADVDLEYLLQIRSMQAATGGYVGTSSEELRTDAIQKRRLAAPSPGYSNPISSMKTPHLTASTPMPHGNMLELFPKVKAWYTQHKACISSTLAGLVRSNAMQQGADRLLNFMFKKFSKSSTGSSSSTYSGVEEKAALPAWDIIEAMPVVVGETLTACSHGKLDPRDLITGVKKLVDFLPATVVSFSTCCGAETYRGPYKPASLNGVDWPSPGAHLMAVVTEIRNVLAIAGVNVPNISTGPNGGNSPTSLPLPIAALISLTITFKMSDRQAEMILTLAGQALNAATAAGPWPSPAVVAALWCQKSPDWQDFIIFDMMRSFLKQNKDAVLQLLRSCFTASLGAAPLAAPKLLGHGGVGALLGHGRWLPIAKGLAPLGPGYVYLKSFPTLHEVLFVSDEILALVADASRDIAEQGLLDRDAETTTPLTTSLRCIHPSLSTAVARASKASTVGASFLTVTGGPALVRKLYLQSIPTWFLSQFGAEDTHYESNGTLLEGYAMARFVLLSGALAWGTSSKTEPLSFQYGVNSETPSWMPVDMSRHHVLNSHLAMLASGLDGKLTIRCKQTTWKAYVIGFIALMVTCTPLWILDVELDTLKTIARGLRWWHQHELALALLERGGPAAIGAAAEHAMGYG